MKRQKLDDAFPTIVRYTGLVLTVLLVFAGVLGYGLSVIAPGFVAATGMILYKTVKGAAEDGPANA
jgi:hypothetical protein